MIQYVVFPSSLFQVVAKSQQKVFEVHPCCSQYQSFLPFHCSVVSHCINMHLLWHTSGCFHIGAIINNALQTLPSCAKSSCGHTFSLHSGRYLGIELLDCMLHLCLTFEETAKPCHKAAVSSYIVQPTFPGKPNPTPCTRFPSHNEVHFFAHSPVRSHPSIVLWMSPLLKCLHL